MATYPVGFWQHVKFFKPEEFACRCGCGLVAVAPDVIFKLDQVRERFGRPIVVTSGTRCPAWNQTVGGRPNSAHLVRPDGWSWAVDIKAINSHTRWQLLNLLLQAGFHRFELSNLHIHFDDAIDLPGQVLEVVYLVG